jgi:predicted ribosomally synthesized peptide with nif11-like leader
VEKSGKEADEEHVRQSKVLKSPIQKRVTLMTLESVAEFIEAAKQDRALMERLKAATTSDICVKVAEEYGYTFTTAELQAGLSKLSQEELATLVNPGVAPRRHIEPR